MKTTSPLVLAGAGLALAAPSTLSSRSTPLLKRTGYDLCENDCNMNGVAYPYKHTLQLGLENNYSEQCPHIYIGSDPGAPTAWSRVCLDVVGTNLYFNFTSFAGYTYKNAAVTWELKGNILDSTKWNSPPPTTSISCEPNPSGDGLYCKLPFSDIQNKDATTPAKDLLAGMCPNGDREGLALYFQFSGEVQSTADPSVTTTFVNEPPCAVGRTSDGVCTGAHQDVSYIEVDYRCQTCANACPPVQPPPVTTSCAAGTAFGYQNPVKGVAKSITLNTQSGQGCNRWGWYMTPTVAELQGGISGPLYVGAGGNDIAKATDVGIWVATANNQGAVTVTYLLNPPYSVDEVHVDLACLPIDKCAPGSYTFGKTGLGGIPTFSNPAPIKFPTCSGGAKAALIVHAAVDVTVQGTVCPAVQP